MSEKIRLDLDKVRRMIEERGLFASFERLAMDNYDEANALDVVRTIGRARCPWFVIDDENKFAYLNFIKWCHGDKTMEAIDPMTGKIVKGDLYKGIYIAGNTGTGKSWCLEIMLAYAQAWGIEIRFDGEYRERNLYWNINRADEICNEYMLNGNVQRFRQIQILGIQDLGQEPGESLYMGNRVNVLQQLLEFRGDRDDQLTLITSNLRIAGDRLRTIYGDRVQSRLVEMCNYLEIKGTDRRKEA